MGRPTAAPGKGVRYSLSKCTVRPMTVVGSQMCVRVWCVYGVCVCVLDSSCWDCGLGCYSHLWWTPMCHSLVYYSEPAHREAACTEATVTTRKRETLICSHSGLPAKLAWLRSPNWKGGQLQGGPLEVVTGRIGVRIEEILNAYPTKGHVPVERSQSMAASGTHLRTKQHGQVDTRTVP